MDITNCFYTSESFFKILIPSILAIILAFLSHQLAISRSLKEKRNNHKIEYLLKAYENLLIFSQNPDRKESFLALRSASMTIQIYGTPWQVEQVRELITISTSSNEEEQFSLDPLLNSLRDELRSELKLEKISGNVYWVQPKPDS
ncbi:hypothetical protein V6760_03905 [Acinetobacter venetianus]